MAKTEIFKSIGNFIATMSVIVGIVISVLNFRIAKEAEAESRKIEAAKPFLELRQKLYFEALNSAAVLASKNFHTEDEIIQAKKRFAELYWGELSLVEEFDIEKKMVDIARAENLLDSVYGSQQPTLKLAHLMRESLTKSWAVDPSSIGTVRK